MNILTALLFILVAGIINGSFALPTKYITKWKFENIWLQYALWAFVILPWVIIFLLVPNVFDIYGAASANMMWIMLLVGVKALMIWTLRKSFNYGALKIDDKEKLFGVVSFIFSRICRNYFCLKLKV